MSEGTSQAPPPEARDPRPAGRDGEGRIPFASQRRLIWWRFRRHRLAVAGGAVVLLLYLVALFADFLAYADPSASDGHRSLIPPQGIDLFDEDGFHPHVHPLIGTRDLRTFERVYRRDEGREIPLCFLCRGYEYTLLGIIRTDIHLIGVERGRAEASLAILGTDVQGRDLFSRMVVATRTSLTIGIVGVGISLVLGVALGGISGYHGGVVDLVIQRVIEILRSIPVIPLWLGLAAALPRSWSVIQVYFAITIIISLIGWTELARVVRGRFLALRHEDFIVAAELAGCSPRRIIFVHMVPLVASHIIAATTLALPLMIISETALSFLGLGLRPPAVSWGVLLQQASNIEAIALTPWLILPVIPVVTAVLAFNFLGDGLRDAADPYGI
ncbi:MAG TPA: ABC transporter permease [Actinomycetota bacterium]|nr:ABC transporter permease [Actinomycetota bacterium]